MYFAHLMYVVINVWRATAGSCLVKFWEFPGPSEPKKLGESKVQWVSVSRTAKKLYFFSPAVHLKLWLLTVIQLWRYLSLSKAPGPLWAGQGCPVITVKHPGAILWLANQSSTLGCHLSFGKERMFMPTDRTGFNWKNTGVQWVNRDVHLDSDRGSFTLMQLEYSCYKRKYNSANKKIQI